MLERFKGPSEDAIDKIVASLGGKLHSALDSVFDERLSDLENSTLQPGQAKEIIAKYGKLNQAVAAASAVLPGPLGILAGAGELVVVTGNQMRMIYDLGCSANKESVLSKGMLIEIPLQALGGGVSREVLEAAQENPAEAAGDLLAEQSRAYAKVIAVKNLKKSLVKCVPVGGALLMAVWTKKSTNKIGKVAESVLLDELTLGSPSSANALAEDEPEELLVERIKIMATLMEQNGEIKDEELAFLVPIIESAELAAERREQLLREAKRIGSQFEIDFAALREVPDLVDDLMSDLVVLARRDGEVGSRELNYLKEVAAQVGFAEADMLDLLDV